MASSDKSTPEPAPSNPLNSPEIDELVQKSQNGDGEAFAKIYDVFVTPIYKYVYFRVNSDDAEDLAELIFLKTWENIRQYRPGMGNFSSWIFRIAHNVVVDHYRAHRESSELSDNLQDMRIEADTTKRIHGRLTKELLYGALQELKDQYRQILVLKFINDFSNQEIARITGRSEAALRILQFRALKKLKGILLERGVSSADL